MEQTDKENVISALQNVLSALVLSSKKLDEDNMFMSVLSDENFQNQLKYLNTENISSIKDFMFIYNYQFDNFSENLVSSQICSNEDFCFILKNMDFVENHFKSIIVSKEGYACSADKSSFIISSLLKHFMNGNEIVLDYEQKYTYHLPKKVFVNHSNIIDFYKAIQFLHYGKSERFLVQLQKVLSE